MTRRQEDGPGSPIRRPAETVFSVGDPTRRFALEFSVGGDLTSKRRHAAATGSKGDRGKPHPAPASSATAW